MDILSSLQGAGNIFSRPELTWGVLGTARIAAKAVIPAIQMIKGNTVIGVASRELARATEYIAPLDIPKAYASYDALLEDPAIQAVYIPLPNGEHAPWAIKALDAGKHVLVEKPFALNADQAQEMVSTALEKKLVLMEAFMYRFDSRLARIIELIRKGEIGKLRYIQSFFSFTLTNPDDFRLIPEQGGGALYDLGCYCVNLQRLILGREPASAQAQAHYGQTGVDMQLAGTLDFGEQVFTQLIVAYNATNQQNMRIVGTEGAFDIDSPFNPHMSGTQTWLTKPGSEPKKISFKPENNYKSMVEHFYNLVITRETARFPLSDAINNMAVIDALYESARRAARCSPCARDRKRYLCKTNTSTMDFSVLLIGITCQP